MPRIKTYDEDSVISLLDKILITDADDNNITKNITISGLTTFLSGAIAAANLEGYTESGLRSSGTLISIIGDYDDSGRGTKITIDDNTEIIDIKVGSDILRITGNTGIAKLSLASVTSTKTYTLQDADGTFAFLSDVFSGAYGDLTGKPTIPTLTSQLTNDGDGISAFALVSSVPTLTSDLTNDSGFITIASVPTLTSELTNDGDGVNNFATVNQLPTTTNGLTNQGADNTSTYVEHDEIATVATTGDYTDLSNKPTAPAQVSVVTKTTTYTAQNGEYVVCDASGGAFVVSLPAATANFRINILKKDSSAFAVTVDANGSETINGSLTQILDAQWDSLTVFSDGTEWFIE
jgi:hypothetical protein